MDRFNDRPANISPEEYEGAVWYEQELQKQQQREEVTEKIKSAMVEATNSFVGQMNTPSLVRQMQQHIRAEMRSIEEHYEVPEHERVADLIEALVDPEDPNHILLRIPSDINTIALNVVFSEDHAVR